MPVELMGGGAKCRQLQFYRHDVHVYYMDHFWGGTYASRIFWGSSHVSIARFQLRNEELQCEPKKSPEFFLTFFPNGWEFLVQILRAYCTFLSTLDYKFLFNYLQR